MGKLQNDQAGFSVVELILVLVIVALVGIVGFMVYKNHNKAKPVPVASTTTKQTTTTPAKTTTPAPTDSYTGWQSYTSKSARYTIKYPSGWTIEGYSNSSNGVIPASQLSGNENQILLYSSSAKNDSFGIWLVNDTKYEATANASGGGDGANVTPYSDGSIVKTLSNGLNIWSQSQSTDNSGVADFEAVTGGQFGYKLTSGTYLQVSMGFGFAYGQKTDYTFVQQTSSTQLTQAESILSSLTQN